MRFMIIRKADEATEANEPPTRELFAAMGAYNEELVNAGVLLAGDGLMPSSRGARVRFAKGTTTVTDGPFTETKELVAGYLVIEAASLDEAVERVKRWPTLDGGGNVKLEIRQVAEAEDFGAEFTPELREQERRIREQTANR